ncbi:MAG: flagellin [Kordiimonadaceae bacterium]|nr:flagellin [Kordiimonadaceae bacterium]MBO6569352.1 flagellin [Kordiimonadaceae bacterium]MBO6964827.1 flagellin [Kordiimonadaceae bacterium]
MVNSINTNAGALFGAQNLRRASSALGETREQISTGRRVNGPDDNAAILAISQILESDIAGLNVTKDSINRAISTADVSIAAGNAVSNLLLDLRETALQASDPGLDDDSRRILNDQFTALRDQVNSIVDNASFNGTNAIQSGGSDITALTGAEGQESVTIQARDLSLGGPNVTLSDSQTIGTLSDAQNALSAIDQSLNNLSDVLSEFGSGANQLEQLRDFTETLSNTTEEGLGNLIDADLAALSAEFEAGQVREALGRSALNIANQQPAALLQLFNNNN